MSKVLKVPQFALIHFFCLVFLINPAFAQEQQKQEKTIELSDTANALPPDTVLPGQKKPFTDAQRLEADNVRFLKRAVLPSAVLIGAGIYTVGGRGILSSHDVFDYRTRTFPNFSTNADDFIMLAPLVGLYGFNLISSQHRHELPRQTLLLISAGALTSAIVWPVKTITDIERPNGKPTAFPSGHTAYAFTMATFMDKEFRHKSPWVSVASYGIAGATGAMRILNNAHWFSDVLAGAGVGILSVNTVYWIHGKLVNNRTLKDRGINTSFVPVVLPTGNMGMGLSLQF
ncbi:phosphatase PAP2 family protein [Pontibacter sp. SGAir0037]|uniref:phosphatase PAP2 family protein n=1 Tax=Pontibacter sp. SGAir0037 TaxID=2571030 RepID=UPI0010CD23C0|nr:phosphatase PAP2 family protein [Pontibacter sp. SGAir0037]QCR24202.1 PAP2 family protein [Pontibacter sp. SGAir0037]